MTFVYTSSDNVIIEGLLVITIFCITVNYIIECVIFRFVKELIVNII